MPFLRVVFPFTVGLIVTLGLHLSAATTVRTLHRIHRPTEAEFCSYAVRNEPVIITGLMEDVRWASASWSDQELYRLAGQYTITVRVSESEYFTRGTGKSRVNITFAEFLQKYDAHAQDATEHDTVMAANNVSRYYAAQIVVPQQLPALMSLIRPSPPFACLGEHLSMSPTLYLGAGGQRTPLHYDSYENLLYMVSGSKRFLLYEPLAGNQLMYLGGSGNNTSPVDPTATVEELQERFPLFLYALPFECEVHEGEVLYLPLYWFHEVYSSVKRNVAVNHWFHGDAKKKALFQKLMCGYRHREAAMHCQP